MRQLKSMDGNNAAAHVSYAFTEVAGIYPITPSSPTADFVDQWAAVPPSRSVRWSPRLALQVRYMALLLPGP